MADLADLVSRLEAVTVRLEKCAVGGKKAAADDDDDDFDTVEAVTEFKAVIDKADALVAAASSVSEEVSQISKHLKTVCEKSLLFLRVSVRAKACIPADMQEVVKPLSDAISVIGEFRDKNRSSKHFNHLSAVSEAVPAFGWVCVAPRPLDYMGEMIGAADFYLNRVLKDFKDQAEHKTWCTALRQLFTALKVYVTENHKKGVTWNPNGGDAKTVAAKMYSGGSAPKAPAAPKAPSAPKAPAPRAPAAAPAGGSGTPAPSTNALFAELNKGAAITSGLKKVSKDQMTHKNPSLRNTSLVREEDLNKNKKAPAPKPAAVAAKKPPKMELVGKKWNVEYQVDNNSMSIDGQVHQVVYAFKCEKSVLTINQKVNSVTLDGCKKMAIIVDDLIASLDVINCQSVKIQVNGTAPIVNIDKTDGCQVFVKKSTGIDTEFVTAKSSEVNVCLVEDSGEYTESSIAEQFVTKYKDGKFVTELYEVVG